MHRAKQLTNQIALQQLICSNRFRKVVCAVNTLNGVQVYSVVKIDHG